MTSTHGDRLKAFREEKGLSQRALASEIGVSQGAVGFVESGEQPPSRKFLEKMRDRFGVSADWLLHGEGDQLVKGVIGFETRIGPVKPPKPRPQAGDISVGDQDYSFVRRLDVRASAGPGRVVPSEDVVGQMAFSQDWLTSRRVLADLCGLVLAEGDSMEPTVPDGALMLVNFGIDFNLPPGIYIARLGDDVVVKRVSVTERDMLGKPLALTLVSDNPAYENRPVSGEDLRDFQPIGRLITVISDV